MQILIETSTDSKASMRAIAYFLLSFIGEPVGVTVDFVAPPAPDDAANSMNNPVDVPQDTAAPAAPMVPLPPPSVPPVPGAAPLIAEYDAFGTPWDARIHQKDKNKKINGAWKNIKGVDKVLLAQVEKEIEAFKRPASNEAPPAPSGAAVPTPIVPAGTLPGPGQTVLIAPVIPPLPVPVGAPPAVEPSSVPEPSGAVNFSTLMKKITGAMASGKLTKPEVDAGLVSVGAEAGKLISMQGLPHLVGPLDSYIDAVLVMKG